jgi:hypothetical protein
LLQAVERFEKEKDVIRILWIRETGWLSDVNAKVRSSVLESVAKIDMPNDDAVMAKMRSDGEE